MADAFDTQKRSAIMRAVKGENTGPERRVRSALHRLGSDFDCIGATCPDGPMEAWSVFEEAAQKASATSDSPSSNSRLPRRDWQ